MSSGLRFVDQGKVVPALIATVPAGSSPTLVSLRGYHHVTVKITGVNTTGVTGAAITLAQSKTVAGANSKALGFDTYWASTDIANSVALTETTAASNTFTTTNTSNAKFMYFIEIPATKLDVNNSFDCFNVAVANATNSTLNIEYLLRPARYAGGINSFVNPLVD